MAKVSFDDAAMEDGETKLVHENGRTLELAGEQSDGEWFACDGDDCFAQGYYVREGDVDVMTDTEGNEVARLEGEADWEQWAEKMLA
jgi:hypothetical protein